jgi:hypothetical protein
MPISIAILIVVVMYKNLKISELEACRNEHLSTVIQNFKDKHPEFHVIHPNGNLSHSNFNQYYQYTTNHGQKVIRLVNTDDFNDFRNFVEHLKKNQYEYQHKNFSSRQMPNIYILND